MKLDWIPGYVIKAEIYKDSVIIKANREGLLSLADHFKKIADLHEGYHLYLDETNSLENQSIGLRHSMSQIEAVYRDGSFFPLAPTHLPENQRVRLTVQLVEPANIDNWLADVRRRQERMLAEHGYLPDSAPDIAKDRLR